MYHEAGCCHATDGRADRRGLDATDEGETDVGGARQERRARIDPVAAAIGCGVDRRRPLSPATRTWVDGSAVPRTVSVVESISVIEMSLTVCVLVTTPSVTVMSHPGSRPGTDPLK